MPPGSPRWRGLSPGGSSSDGPRWIFRGFFLRRRRPGGPSASLRACECFEFLLLLGGVLLVESALWNFHRVEYLFRQGTLR